MCLLATCGISWQENVPPQKLTCPCGHRYWHFFQERFVHIRDQSFNADGEALPMKDREAEVKANKSPEAFEASIRAQFMIHCIGCGIRRRMDDGIAGAGFDTPDFLRAMAELLEIANGNYTSRGRSTTFQELPAALPTQPQEATRPRRNSNSSYQTAVPGRSTRDMPTTELDYQPLRYTPGSQQGATITRVTSAETGPRTSGELQRPSHRALPVRRTSAVETKPADRDQTSRRVRARDDPPHETQLRHRSSRDEPRRSSVREEENVEDGSAPRPTFSALLAKFLAFGDDHHDSIASFCEYNPDIWDEDPDDLRPYIRDYLRRGDTNRARRLAQRLLILDLSWRKSKTSTDQQKWLNKLSGSTRLQDELSDNVEDTLASLR